MGINSVLQMIRSKYTIDKGFFFVTKKIFKMKAAGILMILLFLFSGFSRPKPKVLIIGDSISTYVPESEPGRFTRDVKRYNVVAKKVMRENGVLINDIYANSKRIHKKYGLGDDNVHYNEEGYEHLARYIYRFLRKEL